MTTHRLLAGLLALLLAACAARQPAPVIDRTPAPEPAPRVEAPPPEPEKPAARPVATHAVKRGETLVGIALQYGLDYRELAAWNNITNVNVISVGQVLALGAGPGSAPGPAVATPLNVPGPPIEARPLANSEKMKVEPRGQKLAFSERALAQLNAQDAGGPALVAAAPPVAPAPVEPEKPAGTDTEDIDWMWPVKGKPLAAFTESAKGVDFAGKKGAPVLAAAGGRVIFAGDLRGYGHLVIIKHNATWVSAYAHNDKLVVKEQQDVKKGQKIAEMGSSDTDQVKLHFEVRRQGKPVDPAKVLPAP